MLWSIVQKKSFQIIQFEFGLIPIQNRGDYGLLCMRCESCVRTCGSAVRPSHQLYITYITHALYQTTQPTPTTFATYVFSYGGHIVERSTDLRFEYISSILCFFLYMYIFEHIELTAKLPAYFLRSNKNNINQYVLKYVCLTPPTHDARPPGHQCLSPDSYVRLVFEFVAITLRHLSERKFTWYYFGCQHSRAHLLLCGKVFDSIKSRVNV